jgi:putative transposase
MPNFRRYYFPGALIFITCVTYKRQPILKQREDVELFWMVAKRVRAIYHYHLLAYVILPDHFHWILQNAKTSNNFSDVVRSVKRNFTVEYKRSHALDESSQVWQPRFWDHIIRDEEDLENHIHYIHNNPVKHGLVDEPQAWSESSFSFWQRQGLYI